MARDPDEGGVFVFDLVDDEAAGPDADRGPVGPGEAGDPDGDDSGADAPPASRMLGRRMRALAPVAAVLAIVLGTGFAVDNVRDVGRMERIRAVDGGVMDVSAPLEEVWAWEGEVGVNPNLGPLEVADLQGTLAFTSDGELVGLDPASGAEAWTVPLGENAECGPTSPPGWTRIATSTLVCLQGYGPGRDVVVVGPDGAVAGTRALDPADAARYGLPRPGPAGTVLRAKRVGLASALETGDVECTPQQECTGTVEDGQDLQLRAEDAVTGEERWTVTLPFHPTDAMECAPWFGPLWDESNAMPTQDAFDPVAFGAEIGTDLVDLWGCGVRAAVTPDGVVFRAEGLPGVGSTVLRLPTGGYIVQEAAFDAEPDPRSRLFAPDGDAVGVIPSSVTGPQVTDEPEAATLLGADASGGRLQSYATDGTLRWDVPVEAGSPRFIAQVDGTVVSSSWMADLSGLDLTTGAVRWTWDPTDDLDTWATGDGYVTQVFTDGQFLLLLMYNGEGTPGLVSLDAASGELAWDLTSEDATSSWMDTTLAAVDGHLVEITPTGVHGFG